jgi:nicotinamidase-related amidase
MERNSQALTTALLVMDIQTATLGMLGDNPAAATLKSATSEAIAAARKAKMQIIYVVVGFREGFPEIGVDNKSFSAIRNRPGMEALVNPTVDPFIDLQPGELVVTKRRVSAFAGSDLEVILRAHRIEHLVLTGIATSGVVLSTLREASDKDYRMSVLSDACVDMDSEVHNVLMTKVFPRQAEILTVRQWADGLPQ